MIRFSYSNPAIAAKPFILMCVIMLSVAVTGISGCGDSTSETGDDGGIDLDAMMIDAYLPDASLIDAEFPDAYIDEPDAMAADAEPITEDWPPEDPWHQGTSCNLPPCDPDGPEPTDLSGTWTQTLTTLSHDCNTLVETFNEQMKPGHVQTETGMIIPRSGECVYQDETMSLITGVIKGNVMITCEVMDPDQGVVPVVVSVMTFDGSSASGDAWTYLNNVPIPPSECVASFDAEMTLE